MNQIVEFVNGYGDALKEVREYYRKEVSVIKF